MSASGQGICRAQPLDELDVRASASEVRDEVRLQEALVRWREATEVDDRVLVAGDAHVGDDGVEADGAGDLGSAEEAEEVHDAGPAAEVEILDADFPGALCEVGGAADADDAVAFPSLLGRCFGEEPSVGGEDAKPAGVDG